MKRKGSFLLLLISALMVMMISAVSVNAGATVIRKGGEADVKSGAQSKVSAPKIYTVYNAKNGIGIVLTPQSGVKQYRFYRYSAGEGTKFIGTAEPSEDNNYIDTEVQYKYGKSYVYSVRAVDNSGAVSAVSNKPRIMRIMAAMFTSRKATSSSTIELKWKLIGTSKTISGYQIEYARSSSDLSKRTGTYVRVNMGPARSSYTMSGLLANTKYYFRMRSFYRYTVGSTVRVNYSCYTSFFTATTPAKAATYRALCIGNLDYPGTVNDLRGPGNDAQAMAGTLSNYHYTAVKKTNLGRAQILSAIDSAFKGAASNDVSLFFYSGHGAHNSSGTMGYLCGTDDYNLDFSTLATALSKVPGTVIVILDSCHSGNAILKDSKSAAFDPDKFNRAAIDAFARVGSASSKNGEMRTSKFLVLTAGTKNELTNDILSGGVYGGKFARAFVAGAGCSFPSGSFTGSIPCDSNSDKKITLTEMYNYTRAKCLIDSGYGDVQHVERYPEGSNAIIMRR